MLDHEVWRPQLDDDYWRELRTSGPLEPPNGELFLMHWLTMKLRRWCPRPSSSRSSEGAFLSAAPPPNMAELDRRALPRRARRCGVSTTRSRQCRGTSSTARILDTRPCFRWCFPATARSSSPRRRRRALRMIESWLVRTNADGSDGEELQPADPGDHRPSRRRSGAGRRDPPEELRTGVGEISRWPTTTSCASSFPSEAMYGYIAQARLVDGAGRDRGVSLLKQGRGSPGPDEALDRARPSAELGRTLAARRDLAGEELEAAEAGRSASHLIGNLTLTTLPLNVAVRTRRGT